MNSTLILNIVVGLTLFISTFGDDVPAKQELMVRSNAFFAEDGKWRHLLECLWYFCEMYGSFRLDCYRMWEMTMALESWMVYEETKAKGRPEEYQLKLLAAKPLFTKNGQYGQMEMEHEEVMRELIEFHYEHKEFPVLDIASVPISWLTSPLHQLIGSKITKRMPNWANQKECEMVNELVRELGATEQTLKEQQQQVVTEFRAISSAAHDTIGEIKEKLHKMKSKIDHEPTIISTLNMGLPVQQNGLIKSLKAYSNMVTKPFDWYRPSFTKQEVDAAKRQSVDEKQKEAN